MMKEGLYEVIEDITMFGIVVASAGSVLKVGTDGNCELQINGHATTVDAGQLPPGKLIPVNTPTIYLSELTEEHLETPSTWRLQMDLRTTSTKARIIEKFLRDTLPDML
jgi:hypothetical protein